VPFDHEAVTLEGHAGGPQSEWNCEHLFFSYAVRFEK